MENSKLSFFSSYSSGDLTIDQKPIMLLSNQYVMKLETKFITHLNEKYLKNEEIHVIKLMPICPKPQSPLIKEKSEEATSSCQKEKKNSKILEEKKKIPIEKKKHQPKLKIETGKSAVIEEVASSKLKSEKTPLKPVGLVRSITMSPTKKSALKPRYSDDSPRKKFRVKFNKKDQVFKVENFKEDLKKLKLYTPY